MDTFVAGEVHQEAKGEKEERKKKDKKEEGTKKKKGLTTPAIPVWSPTTVLRRLDRA